MPMVRHIARRYWRSWIELDDLEQIGVIGLLAAVRSFDPDRGVCFATYAFHHIAGEIRHYLRDGAEPIRVPRRIRALYDDFAGASAILGQHLGRTPTMSDIATQTGLPRPDILEALAGRPRGWTSSIEALTESGYHVDRAMAEHSTEPVEDRSVIAQAIQHLPPIQRQVVYYLFYQDLTQCEVARLLGMSQRHVSRLMGQALRCLAGRLCDAGLAPAAATARESTAGEMDPA